MFVLCCVPPVAPHAHSASVAAMQVGPELCCMQDCRRSCFCFMLHTTSGTICLQRCSLFTLKPCQGSMLCLANHIMQPYWYMVLPHQRAAASGPWLGLRGCQPTLLGGINSGWCSKPRLVGTNQPTCGTMWVMQDCQKTAEYGLYFQTGLVVRVVRSGSVPRSSGLGPSFWGPNGLDQNWCHLWVACRQMGAVLLVQLA